MAHFARVENGIVTHVLVVPNEEEHRGEEYLNAIGLEGRWIQTSYNTWGNQHLLGGEPLRGNYAGKGFSYDEERDVFIPPQPDGHWVLNEETLLWENPEATWVPN